MTQNECEPVEGPVEMDEPLRTERPAIYKGPSSSKTWKKFFHEYCKNDIQALAGKGKVGVKTLLVRWPDINLFNSVLAQELIDNPTLVLLHMKEGLEDVDLALPRKFFENNKVSVRPILLPKASNVRDLRDEDVEKLIRIDVTVRNMTEVLPYVTEAAFQCTRAGCERMQRIPQDTTGKWTEPSYCDCSEKKGQFKLIYRECERDNFQRLKVQEHPDELRGGERAETFDVNTTGDLVRQVMAGERVTINGIIRVNQRKNKEGKTPYFEMYMDAVSIEKQENEYADIEILPEDVVWIKELSKDPRLEEKIVKSIAPSIFGYEEVKLSIAHQMFSGGEMKLPDGSRARGDIHIFLIGDPGIAKSQILRYVSKLAPRGIFASGKSSSSAGLTAAAVKDEFDGQWTLEAGALVLGDKGVVCIDEIEKMGEEVRSSLHEAMEQQSISFHKAGINAELKCRCSILAAGNPKFSHFDPYETIADQIDLPRTLLSRFDLIFPLQDKADEKRDGDIAEHILRTRLAGELMSDVSFEDPRRATTMKIAAPEISPERLKKYIAYSKRTIHPILSDEAIERLKSFYTNLRIGKLLKEGQAAAAKVTDSPMPITARQLEGGARIAEASARMRLSPVITKFDADRAIRIISACLKQVAMDEKGNLDINRLNGEMTTDQRTRIKGLKQILMALKKEYPAGVPRDLFFEKAKESIPGMTEDKFEKEIKKLLAIGEIYEPKNGLWSVS